MFVDECGDACITSLSVDWPVSNVFHERRPHYVSDPN